MITYSQNLFSSIPHNNMHSVFDHAASFNQGISSWNTSRVKDISRTFWCANVFNQNLFLGIPTMWKTQAACSIVPLLTTKYFLVWYKAGCSTWSICLKVPVHSIKIFLLGRQEVCLKMLLFQPWHFFLGYKEHTMHELNIQWSNFFQPWSFLLELVMSWGNLWHVL